MGWILTLAAAVAAIGWLGHRRRMAALRGSGLTDDQIRHIENAGRVELEEPLDLDAAADEEERFWDESWDQPEPW